MEIQIGKKLYAIRSPSGRWFKRVGGRRWIEGNWTDNFEKAAIYPNPNTPRAIISRFANSRYDKVIPQLAIISVDSVEVVEEPERLAKAKADYLKKNRHKIEEDKKRIESYIKNGLPSWRNDPVYWQQQLEQVNELLEQG